MRRVLLTGAGATLTASALLAPQHAAAGETRESEAPPGTAEIRRLDAPQDVAMRPVPRLDGPSVTTRAHSPAEAAPRPGMRPAPTSAPIGNSAVDTVRASPSDADAPGAQPDAGVTGAPDADVASAPDGATVRPEASPPGGVRTWTVQRGDHLWHIAEADLAARGGTPSEHEVVTHWRAVVEANRHLLPDPSNPDLIHPGMQVVLPELP